MERALQSLCKRLATPHMALAVISGRFLERLATYIKHVFKRVHGSNEEQPKVSCELPGMVASRMEEHEAHVASGWIMIMHKLCAERWLRYKDLAVP